MTAIKKRKKKPRNLKNSLFLKTLFAQLCGQPMRFIRKSWHVDSVETHPDTQALFDQRKPVIYAVWHGRMYILLKAVPLDKTAILVSASNDGEFITRIARTIGFRHFIRGSHKRGGIRAVLTMHRTLQKGRSIAFTVDGPRGPRYKVKPGIIRLAAQTGAPIVPLASSAKWLLKKFDRSWDHFHPPFFFSPMHLIYGAPFYVPGGLDDDALKQYGQQLEDEMMRLNLKADAHHGFKGEERL